MTSVMISGGFDPLHVGHLDYIQEAAKLGDELIVAVNSDEWLMRKKGFVFMPFAERCRLLENMRNVDLIVGMNDDDDTACDALRVHKPDLFANGGDRISSNTPEEHVCKALGIQTIYGVGGGKSQASSNLAPSAWVNREWGRYLVIGQASNQRSKILEFNGKGRTRMQRHRHRTEHWVCIQGDVSWIVNGQEQHATSGWNVSIRSGVWHQVWGEQGSRVFEIWECDEKHQSEEDIEVQT